MINVLVTLAAFTVFVVFGIRTLNDFGLKFVPKIPIPFVGEFTKNQPELNMGGGKGGDALVVGSGTAIGGPGGKGGDGGSAVVNGDGFAAGGEGGEAGQLDRGGRGGRSGYEAAGLPNFQLPDGTWMYDYGRGGDGANPTSTPSQ